MNSQVLNMILGSCASLLSAVVFILTIVTYKKTERKPLFAIIGSAVMLSLSIVSIKFTGFPFYLAGSIIFLICLLIQFSIILATDKNKKVSAPTDSIDLSEFDKAIFEENTNSTLQDLSSVGRKYFIHAAECFSDESNIEKLVEYINKSLIEKTNADGGLILLLDDFDDVLTVKSLEGDFPPPYKLPDDLPHKELRVKSNMRYARLNLDDNILGQISTAGKPEIIKDAAKDGRIYQNGPEDFLKTGSYIFIPLKIKDTMIGLIALSRNFGKQAFSDTDFEVATSLTKFAGAAINCVYVFNQIQEHEFLTKDSDLAAEIQKKILPKNLPSIPTVSLGNYYSLCQGVCGDYFDIIPARKDRVSFVMADVAGKGINSLLIMVMLRAIVRLVVNSRQDASTILEWINRGISKETSVDHFASIALINYDTTSKKIQYSTAGTTPIYLYKNATKEMTQISNHSEPIGVANNLSYTDTEMDVECGDIIITFTDGLVEAIDEGGKAYSVKKLTDLVAQNSNQSGKEIAKLVKNDISKFMGNAKQHDDQTVLVIKIQ